MNQLRNHRSTHHPGFYTGLGRATEIRAGVLLSEKSDDLGLPSSILGPKRDVPKTEMSDA
jgi:hypothetical protein